MATAPTRDVIVVGDDSVQVAAGLAEQLAAPDLRIAFVFADWRLDPHALAAALARTLAPAATVGCTTIGVIGASSPTLPAAAALGLYGDWVRAGVGVATELPHSPLARSRDAVERAVAALGTTTSALDPTRHLAITLVDGSCGHEEAFCVGSAAAAPQIRVVGGSAATELGASRRSYVWANGEALADAGIVVVLDSALRFHAVTSAHLRATALRTVVTAASGRVIHELDGRPATARLSELLGALGVEPDALHTSGYSFARFVGGAPYVRSMTRIRDDGIQLAAAVEPGHVLHIMEPGDLIGATRTDLANAADRVGGAISALFAFSCIGRHWEAARRGLERELAATYAAYPTAGFQSFGEQTGTLLVNHTLTGLAIGTR